MLQLQCQRHEQVRMLLLRSGMLQGQVLQSRPVPKQSLYFRQLLELKLVLYRPLNVRPSRGGFHASSLTASTEALILSSYRFLRSLTFRKRRSSKKSAKIGGRAPKSVARSSGSGESGARR